MRNHQEIEKLARELRRREIARLTQVLVSWISNQLRSRHEAALRRRACSKHVLPVLPTPV